jgi:acetylornithine deacetylase/succinyl-diaminopimelate desuccinylase-like protein
MTPIDTAEVVPVLQTLIRNACVNTGPGSEAGESRNAETVRDVLSGSAGDLEVFEPTKAGRGSVVARIEGSDPGSPSLCLMGHLDVVPANADNWRHDPFGGDLIDGEVWGRGAVDMLNQTAAMAVAFRRLADSGFKPRGTLVFFGVADEEAGGQDGAGAMVDQHPDLVVTDYCLTEVGGAVDRKGRVFVGTAEKGGAPVTLTVRGVASHGSVPYGSDNALVTAAEVVRRIAATRGPSDIIDTWRGWVAAQGFDEEMTATLLDPDQLWDRLPTLGGLAGQAHACTHLTAAPTMVVPGASQKINVIPDQVRLGVDIRLLPTQGEAEVRRFLTDAIGDLADRVDIKVHYANSGTASPIATPLWDTMQDAVRQAYPSAILLPSVISGTTDARWLRPAGVTTYGFGLLSNKVSPADFWSRFHGKDERIDVESLNLSVELWEWIASDFLS